MRSTYPCALSDPAGLCFTDGQKRDLHEAKVFYLRRMVSQSMERLIRFALEEDLGTGDCTSESSLPRACCKRVHHGKEDGVVAGLEVAEFVFEVVDASLTCELLAADGDAVTAGQRVLRIAGAAKSILIGERLALNFIRMSGIASRTAASWFRSPAPNAPCLTPVNYAWPAGI